MQFFFAKPGCVRPSLTEFYQGKYAMSSVISIVVLIIVSAVFYFVVAFLKNIISRLNLKYALKIKFGNYQNHINGDKKESAVNYSYFKAETFLRPSISHLNIRAATHQGPAKFLIVREGWFDKLFKLFGVSNEFQTGFSWFDRSYYIVTEYNGSIQKILCNEKVLKSIDALLREGFDYLKYYDGILKASYCTFTGWRWFRFGVIERCTTEMATLQKLICDELFPNQSAPSRYLGACNEVEDYLGHYINLADKDLRCHPRKWVRQRAMWLSSGYYVAVLGTIAMVVLTWFSPYPVTDIELVMRYSLFFVAIPIMTIHVLAAGMHLKGRSRSHKELYWIALLCSFGYSFTAALMLQIANGVFDNSPLEARPTILMDTHSSFSTKGPTTYTITVKPWPVKPWRHAGEGPSGPTH